MLDPRWHTFLVLCETMNYTRAAERLCLTQPAVTHHIHYLEAHYGCRLFTYQGKTLRLTPAGARLREFTRSMAYNCQKAEAAMASPAPVCLRVGASKTIGEYVVAPHIERFLRAQPQATFSLTVDNTQGLLQALEEGRLDFALVEGYFDRSRYSARLYRQEAFFGICAPGHRLAGRTVPLEELERERLYSARARLGHARHSGRGASPPEPGAGQLSRRGCHQRFHRHQNPGGARAGRFLPVCPGGRKRAGGRHAGAVRAGAGAHERGVLPGLPER